MSTMNFSKFSKLKIFFYNFVVGVYLTINILVEDNFVFIYFIFNFKKLKLLKLVLG